MNAKLPAQPNKSVMEGLDVLFHLAQKGIPTGVREMARDLEMTPSRAQRYLGTLAHLGLTAQNPDRKYTVGPAIHVLSAIGMQASGLVAQAVEILPPLSETGCVVALGVLWRSTVSYLYFRRPDESIAYALGKTEGYPAQDSVIGQVMLANQASLPSDTQNEYRQIRKQGFARIDRESGSVGLAVPVGSPAIAGLAVTGPISDESAMITLLQTTAARLVKPGKLQ